MNIRKLIEPQLPAITRPARYLGNEWGAVHKDWAEHPTRIALAFPDLYEVGMSHLGSRIIYDIINRIPGALAERVYAPDLDLEALLREKELPLFALESGRSLKEFDTIGFSLSYELTYTNVLNMLALAGIPLESEKREAPLVFAGGPSCCNPQPLADYMDFFVLGDGEEVTTEIVAILAEKLSKQATLEKLAKVEGVYVPSLNNPARKRVASLMSTLPGPVPYLPIVHERVATEVRRGCDRGCRFCQAGSLYLPVRELDSDKAVKQTHENLCLTGYEEFSLFSLSSGDYTGAHETAQQILEQHSHQGVSMSLPSLRVDSFAQKILEGQVRRSTLTFAPEAGSQRLRDAVNKGISEEEIISAISAAYESGWSSIKVYFMIGLPTETQEDLDAIIDLVGKIKRAANQVRRADPKPRASIRINATVSTFVPKPHTPFQWRRQDTLEEIRDKQRFLMDKLKPMGVSVQCHDPKVSELECVISRGDRQIGQMIKKAFELGCRHDAWREHFRPELWQQAAEETGVNFDPIAHRDWSHDEPLPWDGIDFGLTKDYLAREDDKATEAVCSTACTEQCRGCTLCQRFGVSHQLIEAKDVESGRVPLPIKAVCRVQARFEKGGDLRFIAHLDLMRLFERATKRAGLPLVFSQGFNPRPAISFATALALGTTSDAEWVDISFAENITPQELIERLNGQLPDGIHLVEAKEVPTNAPSLMAQVARSTYRVTLKSVPDRWDLPESLTAERKSDKGTKQVEIRPWIYGIQPVEDGVEMELACGSRGNLKPEEALRTLATHYGTPIAITGIHRTGLILE